MTQDHNVSSFYIVTSLKLGVQKYLLSEKSQLCIWMHRLKEAPLCCQENGDTHLMARDNRYEVLGTCEALNKW